MISIENQGGDAGKPGAADYCPNCGAGKEPGDMFCRSCGKRLPTAPAPSAGGTPATEERGDESTPAANEPSRRRPAIIAGVLLAAVALAAAAIVLLGDSEPSQAEQQAVLAKRLKAPFTTAMRQRDELLLAERTYLRANKDATSTLRKYERRADQVTATNKRISEANQPLFDACYSSAVACPSPTYEVAPNVPDVGSQVSDLREAAKKLGDLNAAVLATNPEPELKAFYAQLGSAIQSLQSDATYNADTLSKAVSPGPAGEGEGGSGNVDKGQIKTLHDENALPAIRQLNAQAVLIIGLLGLPIASYDVPGGRDLDPSDHSNIR